MQYICWQAILGFGLIALGISASCADQEATTTYSEEIVGGTNTTISARPWQVALTTNSGFLFCSGAILNASWVVTAQQCVADDSSDMRVVAGVTRLNQQASGQIRAINGVAKFPGFTAPDVGGDIALLHLATPLDLSGANAKAIALVTAADVASGATNPGMISTVTGWGTIGLSTSDIQTCTLPMISNMQASIPHDQLAANPVMGCGCDTERGAPLTVLVAGVSKLAGVFSWNRGCTQAGFPNIYARVSSFEPWITSRLSVRFKTPLSLNSLSGASSSFTHRSVTIPAGVLTLSAIATRGSGDADLYLRLGSQPTTSTFTCRPFLNGNNEFCTIDSPASGTWFISLRGFAAYSGVSLTAAMTVAMGPNHPPMVTITPTNGSTVMGILPVSVNASDIDGTVVNVKLDLPNSTSISGTTTVSAMWNSTAVSDGSYTFRATATDDDGATTMTSVTVAVVHHWLGSATPNLPTIDSGKACTDLTVNVMGGDSSLAKLDISGRHLNRVRLSGELTHNGKTVVVFPVGTFPPGDGPFSFPVSQPVSGLFGDTSGKWILCITDNDALGDVGVLNTWSVHD